MLDKNYLNQGFRLDGRSPLINRSLTILIGSKGGFCDLTQGKTRIIVLSFVTPSIISRQFSFHKVCFSFKFFCESVMKKSLTFFPQNKINFFFLSQYILPFSNFLKNWNLDRKIAKILGFNPKLEFKIGIIENDGNLQDLIALGICLTLKSLEMPYIEFHGQSGLLRWKINNKKWLNENEIFFICNSFSIREIFDGSPLVLMDPDYSEEFCSNSLVSIFIEGQYKIKQIKHGYNNGLSEEILLIIYRTSLKNFSFLGKLLKRLLTQKILNPVNKEIVILA